MTHLRRPTARRLSATLVTLSLMAMGFIASSGVPAAAATTATFNGGTLTVTGGNTIDVVTLECTGGNIKINTLDPSNGTTTCAAVTQIVVNTKGGDDVVNAEPLTVALMPNLSQTLVHGGDGDDTILGTDRGNDQLYGDKGNDLISTGRGSDDLFGGPGRDIFFHTGVNLTLNATTLTEGVFNDDFVGFEHAALYGTDGIDSINATGFPLPLEYSGNDGADVIVGGDGDDVLDGDGGADNITGGAGDDLVKPGSGDFNDTLAGGIGTDTLIEPMGESVVVTNTQVTSGNGAFDLGTDSHSGFEKVQIRVCCATSGNTSAFSGPAYIEGDGGAETLTGGAFNDVFDTHSGGDSLFGNGGTDRVIIEGDEIDIDANGGTSTPFTFTFNSIERATLIGDGDANHLDARQFPGKVQLSGLGGNDVLLGGPANDKLFGGDGKDSLLGRGGNDRLDGGAGKDKCKGGSGKNKLKNCP